MGSTAPVAAVPSPPPLPSLPRPLFDRVMAGQWTAIGRSDDLSPFLPLLAFHVDCAIRGSDSASSALSNPSTIALLRATAAYPQLKAIQHYSNLDVQAVWRSLAQAQPSSPTSSPLPPALRASPPPPPFEMTPSLAAFDELPHAERLRRVLAELHRLEALRLHSPDAALTSDLFAPPFYPHLAVLLPVCCLYCHDFLPLSSLASLLLRLSPLLPLDVADVAGEEPPRALPRPPGGGGRRRCQSGGGG